MTDRTVYQLERAMDALTLAIKYLKEDMQPYKYSISKEVMDSGAFKYELTEVNPYTYYSSTSVSE